MNVGSRRFPEVDAIRAHEFVPNPWSRCPCEASDSCSLLFSSTWKDILDKEGLHRGKIVPAVPGPSPITGRAVEKCVLPEQRQCLLWERIGLRQNRDTRLHENLILREH